MKKIILMRMAVMVGLIGLTSHALAEHVESLRGAALDDGSTDTIVLQYQKDEEPIPRDYLQQPPLIPHKIDGYQVTIKHNKCLSCHSWSNYKAKNATKISQTHFESRDGAVMSNVSARRYFCSQCHVPQVDAQPLVENTFEPVDAMRH
jgi:cytochrome c-type protein NapB